MKTEVIGVGLILLMGLIVWAYYKVSKGAKAEQQAKDLKAGMKKNKEINKKLSQKDQEFEEKRKEYKKGRKDDSDSDRVKPWWMR